MARDDIRDEFERDFYDERDEQPWEREWRDTYRFEPEELEQ